MLDQDYSVRFESLVGQTDYDIKLPPQWEHYFRERGQTPTYPNDQRGTQRLKVRTRGLLWSESHPAFCVRPSGPIGIYTRDFARQGVGVLIAIEIYPEDVLRIALPTFWLRVKVKRVRRRTDRCYEVGCGLIQRFDPDLEAFRSVDLSLTCIN